MKVAFRVDASVEMGSGHAIRCLNLANTLKARGAQTCFIGDIELIHVARRIIDDGHPLIGLQSRVEAPDEDLLHSSWLRRSRKADASICLTALADFNPSWLVVDHYALEAEWERELSKLADRTLVIDDLADRRHDCDIILDQNFRRNYTDRYVGLVPDGCRQLMGPSYALLQPEYSHFRLQTRPRSSVGRVLVYFGGGDPDGQLTIASLKAVRAVFPTVSIDVVFPFDNPPVWEQLSALKYGQQVFLYETLPSLAPLMINADLAIGAVGTSSWERLCLGLPAVAFICAENQREVALELEAAGLIYGAGPKNMLEFEALIEVLRLVEKRNLTAWSTDCSRICDGQGARVVAEFMYETGTS